MNPLHSPRPMPKAVFVSLVCGKAKEDQVTPRQMFKIVIYAAMNHIYSSRDIETA